MRGVGSSDSSAFRLSLVIEYPNKNAAPAIGRQECLRGTIVALQFSDALSEIEHLRENARLRSELEAKMEDGYSPRLPNPHDD